MTPDQAEAMTAALLAAVIVFTVPAMVRLTVYLASDDARPLWEPQWKREARELSRYIPVGDEWGR